MFQTKNSRTTGFIRKYPILLLLLLSPGIPEYLTGSSPLNAVILNPPQFLLQIVLNLGLYGPGVILIREAAVRWRKGWASVLLLGAAYGILEEGIALSTLYNPLAQPVGQLGTYGHFWGVNWIWAAGILPVHMIFSIALPILLLGFALPKTNGKSLIVSKKRINVLFAVLALDVSALFLLVTFGAKFWMGWPVFLGSIAATVLLTLAAKKAPPNLLHAQADEPKLSPFRFSVVGAFFYTCVLLIQLLGAGRIPEIVDLGLVVAVQAMFLLYILRVTGRRNSERQLIALAGGLVVPIAVIGFLSQFYLPIVAVADLAFAFFIWKLNRKYKVKAALVLPSVEVV